MNPATTFKQRLGQNIVVSTILAASPTPLEAYAIAATFRQGRKTAPK